MKSEPVINPYKENRAAGVRIAHVNNRQIVNSLFSKETDMFKEIVRENRHIRMFTCLSN